MLFQAGGLTPDIKHCKDSASEVQLALTGESPGEGLVSCLGEKVRVAKCNNKTMEPGTGEYVHEMPSVIQ